MKGRGFTLIELLVVIGIIALLATLVLVALRSLRRDAFNARIQSNVRQLRVLAESAYDSNGASYIDWTLTPAVATEINTLRNDTDEAHSDAPGAPYVTVIRETQAKDFCVSAPFHTTTGGYTCVDATGVFKTTTDECPEDDGVNPLRCPAS